jgi:hypothetical protein
MNPSNSALRIAAPIITFLDYSTRQPGLELFGVHHYLMGKCDQTFRSNLISVSFDTLGNRPKSKAVLKGNLNHSGRYARIH